MQATGLPVWLEDTFQEQLLLAKSWFEDRNSRQGIRVRDEYRRRWRRLYHDNGSCLEIANSANPLQNTAVVISQVSPAGLIVADAEVQVRAKLTLNCLRDFETRFPTAVPLGCLSEITIRDYTIRYTSYGPRSKRLLFVLRKIDWLERATPSRPTINDASTEPIENKETIAAELQDIDLLRAQEDAQCLRLSLDSGEDDSTEPVAEAVIERGNMADNNHSPNTQNATQLAFGTQVAQPVRSEIADEQPQFLGIRPLEPVLAGNTRREDLRPEVNGIDMAKKQALLSLLNPHTKNNSSVRPTSERQGSVVQASQQPNSSEQAQQTEDVPPELSPKNRSRHDQTEDRGSPRQAPGPQPHDQEDTVVTDDYPIYTTEPKEQCSWMKGFVFSREALKVDQNQESILQRPTSWYKPEAGTTFPNGNIPITILRVLSAVADEKAALEDMSGSDSEPGVDPTPDSLYSSHPSARSNTFQEQELEREDELVGTQITWSASPTPEPPTRPNLARQELPPDSSFEPPRTEPTADSHQYVVLGLHSSAKDTHMSSPPSSPPRHELPADSDEDMEMETSVPQGLGEDVFESSQSSPKTTTIPSSHLNMSTSIIQVEDTPRTIARQEEPLVIVAANSAGSMSPTPISNGLNESPSLTMDHEMDAASPQADVTNPLALHQQSNSSPILIAGTAEMQTHTQEVVSKQGCDAQRMDVDSFDLQNGSTEIENTLMALSEPGRHAPAYQRESSADGAPKRKLDGSPTKGSPNKRRPKKCKIRVMENPFGDSSPPSQDPTVKLRMEKAEAFRKFQEERRAGATIGSRSRSGSRQPLFTGDTRSETPSKGVLARSRNISDISTTTVQQAAPSTTNRLPANSSLFAKFKMAYPEYTGNKTQFLSQCRQMYKLEQEEKLVPNWQWDDYIIVNRTKFREYVAACLDQDIPPQEYYRFYKRNIREPQYKKCIIDSTEDLLRVFEELGENNSSQSPERHRSNELNEVPPPKKASGRSLPDAFAQQGSSLPDHVKEAQRPRHSLPVNGQVASSTAKKAVPRLNILQRLTSDQLSSSNKFDRPASGGTPSNGDTGDGDDGDEFRNFIFAMQRNKSWTGSDKVTKEQWPRSLAVRPSILDVPRRKVDVLEWTDTL